MIYQRSCTNCSKYNASPAGLTGDGEPLLYKPKQPRIREAAHPRACMMVQVARFNSIKTKLNSKLGCDILCNVNEVVHWEFQKVAHIPASRSPLSHFGKTMQELLGA
jgi:hypothetical protein